MGYYLLLCLTFSGSHEIALGPLDKPQEALIAVGPGVLCIGAVTGSLKFFDFQGNLIAKAGGVGREPGRIYALSWLSWNVESQCFIALDDGRHISCFTKVGEHIRDIPTKARGNSAIISLEKYVMLNRLWNIYVQLDPHGPGKSLNLAKLPEHEYNEETVVKSKYGSSKFFYKWNSSILVGGCNKMVAVCNSGTGKVLLIQTSGNYQPIDLFVSFMRKPVLKKDEDLLQALLFSTYKYNWTTLDAPDYWPIVRKLFVDDSDNVWVFGQDINDMGYPFIGFDFQGKQIKTGHVISLPSQVAAGNFYTIQARDEPVLIINPIP